MTPWESCLGQAAHLGHRFCEPGVTMAAWQQLPGWGLHPNKPYIIPKQCPRGQNSASSSFREVDAFERYPRWRTIWGSTRDWSVSRRKKNIVDRPCVHLLRGCIKRIFESNKLVTFNWNVAINFKLHWWISYNDIFKIRSKLTIFK